MGKLLPLETEPQKTELSLTEESKPKVGEKAEHNMVELLKRFGFSENYGNLDEYSAVIFPKLSKAAAVELQRTISKPAVVMNEESLMQQAVSDVQVPISKDEAQGTSI